MLSYSIKDLLQNDPRLFARTADGDGFVASVAAVRHAVTALLQIDALLQHRDVIIASE